LVVVLVADTVVAGTVAAGIAAAGIAAGIEAAWAVVVGELGPVLAVVLQVVGGLLLPALCRMDSSPPEIGQLAQQKTGFYNVGNYTLLDWSFFLTSHL
jgi:hypothetical protein